MNKDWYYFSKLYKKWILAKSTDSKKSLKKYHYIIKEVKG